MHGSGQPEASAHGGRSRAENSFCAIADGAPISGSTSASNGSGDPGHRVVGGVRRGRCRRLTVLGARAHSGIVFRVLSNSTAAPEVLLGAMAAVSPAVLPGAPALQTLDYKTSSLPGCVHHARKPRVVQSHASRPDRRGHLMCYKAPGVEDGNTNLKRSLLCPVWLSQTRRMGRVRCCEEGYAAPIWMTFSRPVNSKPTFARAGKESCRAASSRL
jgi:hypothetical protein